MRHEWYGTAADVYSLGVLTNELCTLETPYEERHLLPADAAVGAADQHIRPRLPSKHAVHEGVIALIQAMWRADPCERPSAATVASQLQHFTQQVAETEMHNQHQPMQKLRSFFRSVTSPASR